MSKDSIIKIRDAEKQADEIRASASVQAKNKIRDAEQLGKRLCEDTELQATRENEKKLALIKEKADEMIARSKDSAKEEAKAETDTANLHMREAIRHIIGGIMEQCQ